MKRSQVLQKASYQKAVALLLEIHDVLGRFKTNGHQQAVVLNGVYLKLGEAIEAVVDIEPYWLSNKVKGRVTRGFSD